MSGPINADEQLAIVDRELTQAAEALAAGQLVPSNEHLRRAWTASLLAETLGVADDVLTQARADVVGFLLFALYPHAREYVVTIRDDDERSHCIRDLLNLLTDGISRVEHLMGQGLKVQSENETDRHMSIQEFRDRFKLDIEGLSLAQHAACA